MPWPFPCDSGYLFLDLLARVFCKFDDCFFSDAAHQNNAYRFCTNPKTGHPSDCVSISIAGHRFLPWPHSINIGSIVKVESGLLGRLGKHTTAPRISGGWTRELACVDYRPLQPFDGRREAPAAWPGYASSSCGATQNRGLCAISHR